MPSASASRPRPLLPRLALALLWWGAGAGVVLGAAGLASGIGLASLAVKGSELGEVQRAVWLATGRAVGTGALAPLGAWTVLAWLLVTTLRPGLDASWRGLGLGLPLVAAAGFPPVGALLFTVWTPETPADWLGTLLLVAGGVSAALLLARLLPPLRPGALAARAPQEPGEDRAAG